MKNSVDRLKKAAKKIKVKLDNRTTITLANINALEIWKERYPNLQIISQ